MVTNYKTSKEVPQALPKYVLDMINPSNLLLRVFDEVLKQKLSHQSHRGAPLVLQLRLASVDSNYVVLSDGLPFPVQPNFSLGLSFCDSMLRALNLFTFANTTAGMTPEDDGFDELSDVDALLERKFH